MYTLAEKRIVAKPWGRSDAGALCGTSSAQKVGEIWFEPESSDILVKYLFTADRLSIQVHPDDAQAIAMGGIRGKDECWLVLEADPDAHYGIGFKNPITATQLHGAALDGSIVDLIDWRRARVGDFIYNPAGTVHALGPGLAVLEIQQNSDITLRLFDYSRGRELQLDEAVRIARLDPHKHDADKHINFRSTTVLVDGPLFGLAYCSGTLPNLGSHVRNLQLITWTAPVSLSSTLVVPPGCSVSLSGLDQVPGGQEFFLAWSTTRPH